MKDMTMFAFFKINQSDIIERACINKDKPMIMCYGKCFLEKKIEQANDTENSTPLSQKVNKPSQITLFLTDLPTINFTNIKAKTAQLFFDSQLYAYAYLSTLFEPPRMAA